MITKAEMQKINALYQRMSPEQETQFLKNHELFYASCLSPFLEDEEDDDELYFEQLLIENPDHKDIEKFIDKVQERLNREDYRLVLDINELAQGSRYVTSFSFMKVLDKANFGKFLVLADVDNEEKDIEIYKDKVKKDYDATATYNMDITICKTLLPKMLEHFRKTTMSHPGDITEEQWDKILLKLVWFCEEIIYSHDQFSDKYQTHIEEYNKKYNECKELMGKYFDDLWS